jgi:hypothetical protein
MDLGDQSGEERGGWDLWEPGEEVLRRVVPDGDVNSTQVRRSAQAVAFTPEQPPSHERLEHHFGLTGFEEM